MSLRLRLIVAFFLLSVVPLCAVTFYAYTSNARAMREAAGHEAELLAGELTQRMQLVTSQLSERVGHLMDMQRDVDVDAPATTGAVQSARLVTPVAPPAPAAPAAPPEAASAAVDRAQAQNASVAAALGEVAMFLNNIEVRGLRGPGEGRRQGPPGGGSGFGGRGGGRDGNPGARGTVPSVSPTPAPPTVAPVPSSAPAPPPSIPALPADSVAPVPPVQPGITESTSTTVIAGPVPGRGDGRRGGGPDRGRGGFDPTRPGPPPDRAFRGPPPDALAGRSGAGSPPDTPAAPGAEGDDRIRFDMMPIRREIMQQLVGSGDKWEQLSQEERQRIIAEVNQRMLGIVEGIQMGAAELQKKVAEAQRAADEKARAAVAAAEKTSPPPRAAARKAATKPAPAPAPQVAVRTVVAPTERKTALSGSRLDVTVERNGQVLRRANAEVNLPNLLASVFTATRRDRGEVPFAVAKDGRIFTPTDAAGTTIEGLGGAAVKPDTPPGTTVLPDWIVVTTADPSGSGLKFGIARPVGESLSELRRTSVRNAGFGLGFIGLALIGIVPLSSRLTRHLSTLSDGVNRIAQGDYSARVTVGANDEIGRLARAFNQMAEDVERHQQSAVEQERIRRELELGRRIQIDMLPHEPLRLGLTEIKGVSVPAREVGGDFFNYFALSDGRIALLVGDVSGKGVGAALLMANIQASLRTRLALGQGLAAIAREIDVDIEGSTPGPVYATLFVGILNPVTRVLLYVNAGHNPQYILRSNGTLEHMSSSGLPVGLIAGHGYKEASVQLAAGDELFFYTDGCVEAENEQEEMFGTERLEQLLISATGGSDLLARVETVVNEFRGRQEPFDDATMMVVRVG